MTTTKKNMSKYIQKRKDYIPPADMSFFDHPVFDSAKEKVKRYIKQLQKQQTRSVSIYTCFKCGSNTVFSVSKQVRSADEGTTVFNECRECHNKWRDG